MAFIRRYLLPRLIVYFLVIFVGITVIFVIPRLLPIDPIQQLIGKLSAQGTYLDPKAINRMIETLQELYGLKGSLWEQYVNFWGRLLRGDFGPSYYQFPVPVITLIKQSLPWTFGLLLTTTIISWIIGNILGGLGGYFSDKNWVKILDGVAMVIRPMPYYILALGLLILFAYVFPIFPLGGGYLIGGHVSFTFSSLLILLRHAFLPALSLILINIFVWFQAMKLFVQSVKSEDYVNYAKLGGVMQSRIVYKYVIKNAMLPQITGLALSLGQIFSGALITEIAFSYPGLGTLLYNAIFTGDYNLLMGITTISILVITTSILVIDLLYPLFDPRVRYR
ncbi:ABC transporter permease [Pseudothermotoga lettingae]|uniref:Binding-protein-dependent transport systems inner membrane component n=1 Tax=Pseudothermotoga lettingae (strain ATCC BAA-301 / DSM 14385 / NBRC 107922 / TMO) TaxID=416591 RepID=A8F435_PSELT|nr:ABC transporter permease [Pseudothermotoga lettingae]ABV32919.1 binding-protein-dependent transport systems inner membrane component [Pseudothermotoga lettingae TMO]GLI48082.1 peptide ABC transporter permease [Pseudothermotoga lettingae TMO]